MTCHATELRRARDGAAFVGATLKMSNGFLHGKRVLIVEDETLIALDIEAIVADAGMSIIGPVVTLAEAIAAAESADIDIALLDVSLKGDMIWPAAEILRSRNIPIVFLTGYHASIVPESFGQASSLSKPVEVQLLLSALARLLSACRD